MNLVWLYLSSVCPVSEKIPGIFLFPGYPVGLPQADIIYGIKNRRSRFLFDF